MAGYWPTAEADASAPDYIAEFARIWKEKPKVVFSRTLESVGWNSRLVSDDIPGEIAKLKAEPGGDLSVGGARLAAALIRRGLVDEFRPIVHPVVLGAGTPYLPASGEAFPLRLVETRSFDSGAVYLRYQAAGDRVS
jgi:dihydrofolate reductase